MTSRHSLETARYGGGAFAAGTRIAGKYEIESLLGEGSTGIVYLARAIDTRTAVALKIIHRHLCADRQIFKRFQREAAILKRLEGDHLVKSFDFVEDDGLLIIGLEYVPGMSLEQALSSDHRPSLDQSVEIAIQVCAALGAAHAANVVHRDLKPGNVLLETPDSQRDGVHVRVVDFGLAKVLHGEQSTTGLTEQDMIFGTPEYMAPEQARGDEVDLRCDIYAAGVMLYEMVVGKVPFEGRTPIAKMTAHLTQEPAPPRAVRPDLGISAALESVILRALAKEPAQRYESARAMAEALVAARDERRVVATIRGPDEGSMGTSDTELEVAVADLEKTAALQGAPPVVRSGDDAALASWKSDAASRTNWVWLVLAIGAAAIAIALGFVFGAR